MIGFIDKEGQLHGVEPICKALQIAPSTYDLHAGRRPDPRKAPTRVQRDVALCQDITSVWQENKQVHGARKVWRQLARQG